MFKPLALKTISSYEYIQVTLETLGELYDRGMLDTTLTKEEKIALINNRPTRPIKLTANFSVFLGHYLVIQYNNSGNITGYISFETEDEMLEFFDEIPE